MLGKSEAYQIVEYSKNKSIDTFYSENQCSALVMK